MEKLKAFKELLIISYKILNLLKLLMNDFRDGADIVFDIAYEALRNKTDEQDFIQFNNIIYLYH